MHLHGKLNIVLTVFAVICNFLQGSDLIPPKFEEIWEPKRFGKMKMIGAAEPEPGAELGIILASLRTMASALKP